MPRKTNKDIDLFLELNDEVFLSDILFIIAKHVKYVIIIPIILCSLAIVNVLFFYQPEYESSAKIMSSSPSNPMSTASGFAAQFGLRLQDKGSDINWDYSEIIKSTKFLKLIMTKKFDSKEYGNNLQLIQIMSSGENIANITEKRRHEALNSFRESLSVSEDVRNSVYTLSLVSSERKLAADILNKIIIELDLHQKKYNKAKTSEAREFISDRIIDTQNELESAEEKLKNFSDRNRRIENSPQLQLEQQRLLREVNVLTGVFTTLKQQLETTKIEEVKDSDYILIIDDPQIPLYPNNSKRKKVVIAGIVGVFLGLLLGAIKELFSSSARKEKLKINQNLQLILKNIFSVFRYNPNWISKLEIFKLKK